jgi:antitoxin FitA
VPKTVQIRDIDDDVYDELSKRAAEVGMSVPEYLRRETERIAARPSMSDWVERTRRPGSARKLDTMRGLDELRGPWPG